jgi:hypothetical protein
MTFNNSLLPHSYDLPRCNPLNAEWDSGRMRHRAMDIYRIPSSCLYTKYMQCESFYALPMMIIQTFLYHHFHACLRLQSVMREE